MIEKAVWVAALAAVILVVPADAQVSDANLLANSNGIFLQDPQQSGGASGRLCWIDEDLLKEAQESAFGKHGVPFDVSHDLTMDVEIHLLGWRSAQSGEILCSAAINAVVFDFARDVASRDGKAIPNTYSVLFMETRHLLRPRVSFAEEVLKNIHDIATDVAVKWVVANKRQ